MLTLPDRSWQSIYESRPSSDGAHLVDEFYVPALERSTRYDRIAGYFSSSALAVASRGIDALLENDGEMRLVVGTELYSTDRPVFEALTDELTESLDELDDEHHRGEHGHRDAEDGQDGPEPGVAQLCDGNGDQPAATRAGHQESTSRTSVRRLNSTG